MSEEKSPLDRLLARPDFKPFAGRHAFRVLYMAKRKLKMPPVQEGDVLKAVSSLGVMLETEVAMMAALQQTLCLRCGDCCTKRGQIKFKKEELQTIADALHIEYKKLKDRLKASPAGDGTFVVTQPCPFHRGNICGIYSIRPGTCRGYPANDLLSSMANENPFEDCPIADPLLAEVVVKRVLEEQMWRDHPEELKIMAEKRRGELAKLEGLSPAERMRVLTEGYARSIIEEKKRE
jgi:Fe-S-cluster containining protein